VEIVSVHIFKHMFLNDFSRAPEAGGKQSPQRRPRHEIATPLDKTMPH
jgi:hypothetical protein